MFSLFEELESRNMFSVSPTAIESPDLADSGAAVNLRHSEVESVGEDLGEGGEGADLNLAGGLSSTTSGRHHGHHHGHHHGGTTTTPTPTPNPTPTPTPTPTPGAGAPSLVGSYSGVLNIPAVGHYKNAVLNITGQKTKGGFGGTLTADGVVSVNVSGIVSANRSFTITVVTPPNSNHPGGPINGTGTGTLDATGKVLAVNFNFAVGGGTIPGSLSVTRA